MQLRRNLVFRSKKLVKKCLVGRCSLPPRIAPVYRERARACGVLTQYQRGKITASAINIHRNVDNTLVAFFSSSSLIYESNKSENGGKIERSPNGCDPDDVFNTIETIEVLLQSKKSTAGDSRSVAVEKALLWILRNCSKQDLNRAIISVHSKSNRPTRKIIFGARHRSNEDAVDKNIFPRETMNVTLLFRKFTGPKRKNSMQFLTISD